MMDMEKLLRANAQVDDYRVINRVRSSYEVFFVHDRLETVRATDTASTEVTVYVRHDGKLGDSTFVVYDSMTEADAAAKVDAAVKRARLVFNEPYELPCGGESSCTLPSSMAGEEQSELAARVADAVFAGNIGGGGSINATEIFLYRDTVTVKNSRGVNRTEVKHHAMIEAIPTWNEGNESVELYESYRFTDFDAADVTAEIAGKMREVRDRQAARKPDGPMTCQVVLGPKEISKLMRRITAEQNYSNVYSHANLYSLGDQVQRECTGDTLTVTMAGAIRGCVDSAAFDEDGVSLGEKLLIQNGVVQGYHGSSRYAQYLGEEATGSMSCIRLAPGTMTHEALEAESYLEVVSMSGLQVDLYNDYIGGEIRLAYWHENGAVKPVTGVTMSAKLSGVLAGLRLSDSVTTGHFYAGPDRLLMQQVKVL